MWQYGPKSLSCPEDATFASGSCLVIRQMQTIRRASVPCHCAVQQGEGWGTFGQHEGYIRLRDLRSISGGADGKPLSP